MAVRKGSLLVFPLPHRASQPVDLDDRRAASHIEIGDSMGIDGHGADGKAVNRIEPGRNGGRTAAGGIERRGLEKRADRGEGAGKRLHAFPPRD